MVCGTHRVDDNAFVAHDAPVGRARRACVTEFRAAARDAVPVAALEVRCATHSNAVVCATAWSFSTHARHDVADVRRHPVTARHTALLARAARPRLDKVPGAALHDVVAGGKQRVCWEPCPARRAGQERVVIALDVRRRVDAPPCRAARLARVELAEEALGALDADALLKHRALLDALLPLDLARIPKRDGVVARNARRAVLSDVECCVSVATGRPKHTAPAAKATLCCAVCAFPLPTTTPHPSPTTAALVPAVASNASDAPAPPTTTPSNPSRTTLAVVTRTVASLPRRTNRPLAAPTTAVLSSSVTVLPSAALTVATHPSRSTALPSTCTTLPALHAVISAATLSPFRTTLPASVPVVASLLLDDATIIHSSQGPSFLVSMVHNNLNRKSFENQNREPNGTARAKNTIPAGKKGVKSHGSGFLIWKAFTRGKTFSGGNKLKG